MSTGAKERAEAALLIMLRSAAGWAATAAGAVIGTAFYAGRWKLGLALTAGCGFVAYWLAWKRAGVSRAPAPLPPPRTDLLGDLAERQAKGRELAHQLRNDPTASRVVALQWSREVVAWLRAQGLDGQADAVAPTVDAAYNDSRGSTWNRDDQLRRRAADVADEIVAQLEAGRRSIVERMTSKPQG